MAQTPTLTTLTSETRDAGGHTIAVFWASVTDNEGAPAKGIVTLVDEGREKRASLASAVLDAEGHAEIRVDSLSAGDHSVRAVFTGGAEQTASQSESVAVHPLATATPDFALAIAPATLTLKEGTAGTIAVTITPVNSFSGFISLSCAGTGVTTTLPVGVTCTYSPANLQVNATSPSTATLSIQTSLAGGKHAGNRVPGGPFLASGSKPLMLAVLVPGLLVLGMIGRKRRWYGRAGLLVMLGTVSLLGTAGCAARYNYLNHGPTFGGTPLGSYTLTVTAQSSNGVSAAAHSTSLALTVN